MYGFIAGILIIILGFALKYKELSKEEQKAIGGIVKEQLENKDLSPKEQEGITNIVKKEVAREPEKQTRLSLVDVSVSNELTFDFKLKISGTDSAFLSEVRFVFYPGSGVLSICMPVFYKLYDFPFSAAFANQTVAIAKGNRLNGKYKIPVGLRKTIKERFVYPENAKPFLISRPLKISQVVPPGGVDRFKVRFVIDKNYRAALSGTEDTCRWHEVYEAHAIIWYDGNKELITPKFQLGYHPADYAGDKNTP